MTDNTMIGEKIRRLRQTKKLTQNDFAARLFVSPQAVSNWERGITPPDIENLIRISDELGVTVDYLVRRSETECMLAIDGGGTKTEFAVFSADGRVLKSFTLTASNPNDIGIQRSFEVLSEGIDKCLLGNSGITCIFGAIAGISAGDNKARLLPKLCERYKKLSIDIDTDAVCNLSADKTCSIALICGTGSVAFVNVNGKPVRVGGWGYLFDEAGSAYDIGKDAIRAALAELDGMGEHTEITPLLEKRMLGGVWEKLSDFYAGGKTFIASLAPLVFEAYAKGDPAARSIIDRTARHLATLCDTAASRFELQKRVLACGGIFKNHSDVMLRELGKYTDAEFVISELPPIFGAARYLCELFGIEEGDKFYENFKKTYGREEHA